MKERLRPFVQQATAVVGSPRRWMVGSLIALWVGTELLFHFSRPWLCAVTTGMSMGILFIACRILNTRNRHPRALFLKLDQLERAIQQREKQLKRAMKKRHRGRHNGKTSDEK